MMNKMPKTNFWSWKHQGIKFSAKKTFHLCTIYMQYKSWNLQSIPKVQFKWFYNSNNIKICMRSAWIQIQSSLDPQRDLFTFQNSNTPLVDGTHHSWEEGSLCLWNSEYTLVFLIFFKWKLSCQMGIEHLFTKIIALLYSWWVLDIVLVLLHYLLVRSASILSHKLGSLDSLVLNFLQHRRHLLWTKKMWTAKNLKLIFFF